MILLLIGLIISGGLLALAYVARFHPDKAIKRWTQLVCCALSGVVMIFCLAFYPAVSTWQAYHAKLAKMAEYDAELVRAENMIRALGSTRAYIDYLKVTREK